MRKTYLILTGVIATLSFFFLLGFIPQTKVIAETTPVIEIIKETEEPQTINEIKQDELIIEIIKEPLTETENNIPTQDENEKIIIDRPSSGGGGGGSGNNYTPSNNPIIEPPTPIPDKNIYLIDKNKVILYSKDKNELCFEYDKNNWDFCKTPDPPIEPDYNGWNYCTIEGDSLSSGYREKGWIFDLNKQDNFSQCKQTNYAKEGEEINQMLEEYDTQAHLDVNKELFFVWAGTNDIWGPDNNAETLFADLNSLWKKAKDDNYKVVAFTLQANCNLSGEGDRERRNLNQLIRDNNSQYDYLIELEWMFGDCSTENYETDRLHLNENGHKKVIQEIWSVVK